MRAASDDDVVITGLGLVSALGNDVRANVHAARDSRDGIVSYRGRWTSSEESRVGGIVRDFIPAGKMAKFAARYEPAVNFALAASLEAFQDAGLEEDIVPERFGCIVGSGLPGAELWHRALQSGVSAFDAAAITGNAPSAMIALQHGIRGPNFGVANACASSATAIGLAADQIRLGRADVMITGGCESSMRSRLAYESFALAGGMSTSADPRRASAPFDLKHEGFVLGEGAAILTLERRKRACSRNAPIYGVVLGEGHTNDAFHALSPDPSGLPWTRVMRLACDAAGMTPGAIELISAHGTGTAMGDVAEALAMRNLLGERASSVPVTSTKALHGHTFGASAAIEIALLLACLRDGFAPPNTSLRDVDPACALDHITSPRALDPRVILKSSFGAGGASSCLLIGR